MSEKTMDQLMNREMPSFAIKKKKLSRKALVLRIGILCLLLFLVSSGTIFGLVQYQHYNSDVAQARAGVQHLRTAEAFFSKLSKNPFDSRSVSQAEQEFHSASSLFQQVGDDLGALPGMSTSIPGIGAKLTAARHVLPLAIEASQIGVLACKTINVLVPDLRNPMDKTGPKLTQTDLTTASQNLQQIQLGLGSLMTQVSHLQSSDLQLDPSLGKFIGTFRKDGLTLQSTLNQVQSVLGIAPIILGVKAPANYLLEILDSTELRPGGGFIGSYGLLTLADGHISDLHMTDIDLIDKPFEMAGHTIPYPSTYRWFDLAPASWSFRDSNLDADFPASARNGEQTYALEGGKTPLQGVIAITPWLIQGLLNITGPVDMRPEYNETITAQNLIARIHYHQLGGGIEGSELIPSPDGHSSLRKRFSSYLAEHLIARVHQLVGSPSTSNRFFTLLTNAFRSKDIQMYFNLGAAEDVLQHYQLASSIQAPTGDGLFVVDANISPNKASDFIKYTMNDTVTIDPSGNVLHHTTLRYAWVLPGQIYGLSTYRDYVHIYVPPGSTLRSQDGWQSRGTDREFGRNVWMGYFTLAFGQAQVVMLDWMTPKAATHDAQGWHYHDLIQKQAGNNQWTVSVRVLLPSCAAITHTSGGLFASGKQTATFSKFLSEDRAFSVDYQCS